MKRLLATGAFVLAAFAFQSASAAVGEYKETSCDADYFTRFSCNQCFDGGTWAKGEKKMDFFDNWTNASTGSQIIYQGLQSFPSIHPIAGSTQFASNPTDASKFWKFTKDVIWTDSLTRQGDKEFELTGGKTIRVYESDLGANYQLTATDAANGTAVGVVVFPLTYSAILADGTESAKKTHNECVVFRAAAQETKPVPPTPQQITKPKTGPEATLVVLFALALAAALLMAFGRRRA